MDRRDFLKALAALTPSVMINAQDTGEVERDRLGDLLPQRRLPGSGIALTMLGAGGYHIGWTGEKDAQATIEAALEGGVRFFDTAESYQDGVSETRYGKYLTPKYRDLVFLMTKSTARTGAEAEKHLAGSLKRLNTDHIDLWQIHSLRDPDDVDARLSQGVLDVFLRAKQSGKVRFVGFTGHTNPAAHKRMLERTADQTPFATCQMPVNILDPSRLSFIEVVTPILQKQEVGLLAMKTLSDGRFFSRKERMGEVQWASDNPVVPARVSIEDALSFVWSLPVTVLITGAENPRLMEEKIRLARSFTRMSAEKRQALIKQVADLSQEGKVEYYKREIA
jgi:uncharacterized protein